MANNLKLRQSAILAAYVTVVSVILVKVMEMIGMTVTQLFSMGATSGLTQTVGVKFLAFINKFVAFDIASIATLYISVLLIVIVGNFAMGLLKLPQGKNNWQKVTLVLLYGTAVFYLLLAGMNWMGWGALVGLVIWYAVVAASVGLVQKRIKI